MSDPYDTLKLLADPTRLRILSLLSKAELSVAELQEILEMGQSRISSHLGLLRGGGLVVDRKDGKRTYYSAKTALHSASGSLIKAAIKSVASLPDTAQDRSALSRALDKRRAISEQYFNEIAGRLGKNYCPGRSWEAVGHFLLLLTPQIDIADLGAGEGVISHLLARRAKSVQCIDNSPRMVEVGAELARKYELDNLLYHLGDIEAVPLKDACVDLALLSQALHHAQDPAKAISEAFRILRPGGRIAVLDLQQHQFEKARELYADLWLGFSERDLHRFLHDAGFKDIHVEIVAEENEEPHFKTLLATAQRD